MQRPGFKQIEPIKPLINIGALMDIPTGWYVTGLHGESILLGGLGYLTGVQGGGNTFKSTLIHYMMLSAADRLCHSEDPVMSTYDTEINIHEDRLMSFMRTFFNLCNKDVFLNAFWQVTDKTIYHGDQFWEILKAFLTDKIKNRKSWLRKSPFVDRDKKQLYITMPTFCQLDSFSEFVTSDVIKMQDENEIGASGGNTINMRQGLGKHRLLMELPGLAGGSSCYTLMTAHVGTEISMNNSPYAPQPTKKLQHMKAGEKAMGVTNKFFYLTNNYWAALKGTPLINQNTKGPEYPSESSDQIAGDTDLNLLTIKQLRSKSGPSGYTLELVVSQVEGILPSLTEFHYLKENEYYGMQGSFRSSCTLDLYPDVKLMRTTVRGRIDSDKKLRRALNITSELHQMHTFYRSLKDDLCTPKEIYDYLVSNKYDVDFILEHTRGWWTIDEEKHPDYFLSTLDLCNMVKGKYHPYWLDSDNRSIKKEYQKT